MCPYLAEPSRFLFEVASRPLDWSHLPRHNRFAVRTTDVEAVDVRAISEASNQFLHIVSQRLPRLDWRVCFATLILVSASTAPAAAIPRDLTCTFNAGSAGSYEGSGFQAAKPQPLAFGIGGINLETQSAQLKTGENKAPGTLRIVRALNANHFIEAVTEGFLNLTTIYDALPGGQRYPAVHSRHFGVLGQAVYAQYTGFCQPAAR